MKTLIKNARLIDPSASLDKTSDLLIEDGRIAAIDDQISAPTDCETIDASSQWLIPGLVDLRVRFREPGLEHKATINSEALAAAKAGITSAAIAPDTDPVIDRPSMAQMLIEKSSDLALTRVYPLAALTNGLQGEKLADIWSMAKSGCIGVSNARQPIRNTLVMRRAMQYAASFDLTVHLYAQDPDLLGNGCIHEGATSTRLGLPAIPAAAEIVGLARDLALVETTGVKAHFMGVSCARSVEMLSSAQRRGLPVTADVDIHHLILSEDDMEDFDTNYHIQPPLRTTADRAALRDGVKDGVIQAICSDHQPHDADAKLTPFGESEPGISGLETLLPLTLELVKDSILDISTAIRCLTQAPANILNIDSGSLAIGAKADCCIVDSDDHWLLDKEVIASAGKNTPYLGRTMTGRVQQTFIAGEKV